MKKECTKTLPSLPGIYFFKNEYGTVLYIGKAKSLKDRIKHYFHHQETDWKIQALIEEHTSIDYILTKNETEALLLEAELIKQYQPKFNVLLKSGQPFLYILVTNEPLPHMQIVRSKKEKGTYIGPFLQKTAARHVYNFLIKTFRLYICNKKIEHGCLDYHIGNCIGSCRTNFDKEGYLIRLHLALNVLKRNHNAYKKTLIEQIALYSTQLAFEKAKHLKEYLDNLETIFETIETKYNADKFLHEVITTTSPHPRVSQDPIALAQEIQHTLRLPGLIRTIDCFDISHFQSNYLVGSCIRFTDGIPDKNKFRRFKIKTLTQQNDYAALQEVIQRRYKNEDEIPDLILIDGGKGQLNAAQVIVPNANCASLAKKEEIIFSKQFPEGLQLDVKTLTGKTLISLRDYAHHFAISYHKMRRKKGFHSQSML